MSDLRKIAYVILFARDMKRMLRFYGHTLGLPCQDENEHWTEYQLEGTTLALHGPPDHPPAPTPAGDPATKKGVRQEIVFHADDPIAMRARLVDRGVNVGEPRIVHEAGPAMVGVSCVFEDPEGNTLSVYGIVPRAALEA